MTAQKHSTSSRRWLQEHCRDQYVQQSQKNGLRSRAWFKLNEIHQAHKIFQSNMTVIDLGASPGGWSQYISTQVGKKGHVIACDILPMNPIAGVDFLQGNLLDSKVMEAFIQHVGTQKVHAVLSDMAPKLSGISVLDLPKSMYLVEIALKICLASLLPGGTFLVKVFQGEGFDKCLGEINALFNKVKICKPKSSRARSREVYIVAAGRKL